MDLTMNRKKLEAKIRKLEKSLKNEGFDISADVYNWFNKYCCDILDADKNFGIGDLKDSLENADVSTFADEALMDIAAENGLSVDDIEDYRNQVEYDIESLISDALDYIEYGDTDHSFDKNNADWMDRYKDNNEYTASLESRVNKLENSLKNEDLDTANDMQMECAKNVSFLVDKMIRAAADIEDQAEASGDEKLDTYVYKVMRALNLVQFYLERKLR